MAEIEEARAAAASGEHLRAEKICARLIAANPRNAAAHHLLGNALFDQGKLDRAISAFRRALRVDDATAEVHNDLGAAYYRKAWFPEAEACFRRAIALKPEHAVSYANLGAALRAQGRLTEGRRAYQRALALRVRAALPAFLRWRVAPAAEAAKPAAEGKQANLGDADTLHAAALALEEAKDFAPALARVRAAIERKPERTEYHITLARLLVRSGEHGPALEAAQAALRLEPGSPEVHATLAGIYHPWRDDLAEAAAQRAVELDPASHAGHGNLAAAQWGLGKLEAALEHAREAVRLNPAQLAYRTNLALILKDLERMDEARAIYRSLLAEAPEHPKLALDMGTLATECDGDLEAARGWYRKAQALTDEPRATLSEGLVDLLDARFASGWEKYEARKRVHDQAYQHRLFADLPVWDERNAPPHGRLLVYGEQGLGDEIMFASMLGELAARVPRLALMCDVRLGALFARSFPAIEVIAEPRATQGERVKRLEDVGAAVAAGSLGRVLRPSASEFPQHAGYLAADPAKVERYRERLAALGPGLKAGVSWIGGLQKTGRSRRSLAGDGLRELLALPGMRWVSLQHGEHPVPAQVQAFEGVTADLDELAALVSALDVVVSVCNTNVHVAGALGRPTLVLAPFVPEWRYGLSGERMLWYPSVRVFRQPRYGDWAPVLERTCEALRAALEHPSLATNRS